MLVLASRSLAVFRLNLEAVVISGGLGAIGLSGSGCRVLLVAVLLVVLELFYYLYY